MHDSILDDVKSLLDKEKGDKHILEQIRRAAEHNEVISNYERNYVRKLAEKYLDKAPPPEEKPSPPDVVLPEIQPIKKEYIEPTPTVTITRSRTKNTKAMIGIAGTALAIVIIVAVSLSGISLPSNPNVSNNSLITLQTDLSSYTKGDIISISGKSSVSLGSTITLTIENQNGDIVWAEDVLLKSDGRYSTLAIAGGSGWDTSGTFTLKAEHGTERQSKSFSFKS